jgi:formylglycine-generating enzyme required for sulfatase activity
MTLRLIPAGRFIIGSPPWEEHHSSDEGPQHEVNVKKPFYVGIYPVTQREFEAVMGRNPSSFTRAKGGGPDHPVTGVSWEDAVEFCTKLSRLPAEKEAGRLYQLPTEAEWEYACRAGTSTPFSFGESLSAKQGNFNGGFPYGKARTGPFVGRTTPVGSYPANGFGLYDMHGNVWEWCNGYYYDEEHYRTAPKREDGEGPGGGDPDPRVIRGGCWNSKGWKCRCADRYRVTAGGGYANMGLRVIWQLDLD